MNKANGKWHRFYASAMLFFFAFAQAGEAATTYLLGSTPLVVGAASGDIVATGIYSGTSTGSGITVLSGYTGTIMLENVSIDADVHTSITAPISVEPGASPTIVLSGDNMLRGGIGYAGLSVPSGAEVRLTGDGKLTAQGGDSGAAASGGAGIGGGGSVGGDGGTVTIVGGGVTATGGAGGGAGAAAAGIGGGGFGGAGGFGGGGGAGIGGGGSGGVGGGAAGTVTIVGGVVTATGGGGLGGSGGSGDGGAITITGGVVWARAGNADVQDIGGASSGTTTVITGGSVSADRVRNPRNASQLSFNALLSSDIAGSPGGFASFYVTAPASFIGDYTYVASFDSRRSDTARVWLPTAVASPLPTTSNLLAVADNNLAIALSAGATGSSAYQWQRAASPTGSFGSISGATTLSYNDTGLTNGTTYYYRLLIETSAGSGLYVITSDTVSATARQSGGPGPGPDPTPSTPSTPGEVADAFNDANQGRGVEVTFPTVTLTDLAGVATQLGGLTPNILTPGGITGTTIAPEQENLPNFTGLGRGWGAKIDIQLKSSTATGQIDLLPVGLTFLLSSADLSAANWTDADVVGNTAALLAKAMFAKQQAEGTNAGTLQDLTALLTDIVTITRDPSSPGGVRIDFPFLLANGEGAPKVITDNGKKYLVIFDGDRNGWLRDPVWLFRKAIVPTGIALTPTSLSLKKGESGNVTVVYTPTDATERDILWTGQGTVASVTAASGTVATVTEATGTPDTWVVKGLTEGTVLLTATASADRAKKATLAVTVSPAASELIESMSVSPVPPYHVGTEVDVWVVLKRAPSSVTVSIKRPDGQTDTPTVTINGTSAAGTYTLPELGAYTVTVQATDATGTYSKTASLTVTEREINGDSSSGGCQGQAPGPIMGLLVLALAFARRRWR